jgi:hypothetical protein
MIAIYIGIGFAVSVLTLVGWLLLSRRNPMHHGTDKNLLDAIIKRQSPGSKRQSAGRPGERSPQQLSAVESHLRNAIFDPNARERLVQDAMRVAGCDRQEAIREVLRDYVRHVDLFK